jgi:hypothetical protein
VACRDPRRPRPPVRGCQQRTCNCQRSSSTSADGGRHTETRAATLMGPWPALIAAVVSRARKIETELSHELRVEARRRSRFGLTWMLAFVLSFILLGSVLLAELGWTGFWHHLFHPKPQADAYDLLLASILAGLATAFALYLSAVVAIAALDGARSLLHIADNFSNWWTFPPFLYFCFAMNVLVAAAWGFPHGWVPLLVLPIEGGPTVYCMVQMARVALTPATTSISVQDRESHDPAPG